LVLYEVLGWDRKMLGRLDAFRKVLGSKAAPKYDELLARLNPQRKQWRAASKWGKAIKGVQVRLRMEKRAWKAGETPTFKVDVRNGARDALFDVSGRHTIHEVELDGNWYGNFTRVRKGLFKIPVGGQRDGLTLTPGKYWSRQGARRGNLTFSPGKHTVRVAFAGTLGAWSKADGGKPVRAVSNPVKIEILPFTSKPNPKTPDIAVDDENTVEALRRLGKHGARLTLDKQGQVTKAYLSPAWATAPELALLKTLPKLERLFIGILAKANPPEKIKMTEADLIHLKGLTSLKQLWISGFPVSDASLSHLKGLTGLQTLSLRGSKITDAGLKDLRKALPAANIMNYIFQ
jgi:hypothetical protein